MRKDPERSQGKMGQEDVGGKRWGLKSRKGEMGEKRRIR